MNRHLVRCMVLAALVGAVLAIVQLATHGAFGDWLTRQPGLGPR